MALPLIPIAMAIAQFAPKLIGWLAGDKAESTAEKVMEIASGITGIPTGDPAKILEALKADRDLQLKMEEMSNNLVLGLEREQTTRMDLINKTMQVEAISNSWAQRTWRPFNGFLFGVTIWCDYFLSQVILAIIKAVSSGTVVDGKVIPGFTFQWEHVPDGVYIFWASVLGVTAGTRGWEKVRKVQAENGGGNTTMSLIKEFGKGMIGK